MNASVWDGGQCLVREVYSLVDGSLTLDDGTVVQISQCPECEEDQGPQCCGADMVVTAKRPPEASPRVSAMPRKFGVVVNASRNQDAFGSPR